VSGQPRSGGHHRAGPGPATAVTPDASSAVGTSGDAARTGRVLILPGRAIYSGPMLDNHTHAHHAVQITIAVQGRVQLQVDPDPRWRHYHAVATAPDTPHRLRCPRWVAQIYLDPESAAGLAVRQQLGGAAVQPITIRHPGLCADLVAGLGEPDAAGIAADIDALAGAATPDYTCDLIDPRIQHALTTVHALTDHHVSLAALAEQVGLSPSRLGALFRRDLGLPLRRYLLWLHLIDAVQALSRDPNLTHAAHAAGFSDAAHLTRTFHAMFGMPPSALHDHQVHIINLAPGTAAAPWWSRRPPHPSGDRPVTRT
jgi:AraC family transcriptional regulator